MADRAVCAGHERTEEAVDLGEYDDNEQRRERPPVVVPTEETGGKKERETRVDDRRGHSARHPRVRPPEPDCERHGRARDDDELPAGPDEREFSLGVG